MSKNWFEEVKKALLGNLTENMADPAKQDAIDGRRLERERKAAKGKPLPMPRLNPDGSCAGSKE
jgi:hypothetical protein